MPPLLLTLTEKSIPGGMEVFSQQIKKVFPEIQIVGRETLKEKSGKKIEWPLLRDVQHGKRLQEYVAALPIKKEIIIANGMNAWAFPPSPSDYRLITAMHGTFIGLAENGYSKTDPVYWRMRHIYSAFEKKSAINANLCVANSLFTQGEIWRYYGCNSKIIEPPIDSSIFSAG